MDMTSFDARARDWDTDPMKVNRARVVAKAIRMAIPFGPQTRAFEYGCGTGLLSFALQPYLASITLADASPGMLDVLAGKIRAAGIASMFPVRLDLAVDPLPAEHYHLLYSLMTLHHIPDTKDILQKFHALLVSGGHLCICDLEKEDGSFHGASVTDVHPGFDQDTLEAQAEEAGFRKLGFSRVYTITKSGMKYPLFLLTAIKDSA